MAAGGGAPSKAQAFAAIARSDASGLQDLIHAGLDVNLTVLLQYHPRHLRSQPPRPRVDLGEQHLIFVCIHLNKPHCLKVLLEAGATAPTVNMSAWLQKCIEPADEFSAALDGTGAQGAQLDCATLLIKAGATCPFEIPGTPGLTTLHLACQEGHVVRTRLLIEARVNVNAAKSNGSTALFKAVQENHPACVRVLIDARADLNQRFSSGATALFVAAMNGNSECVRLLLESRADASITCGNVSPLPNATPLQIAEHVGKSRKILDELSTTPDACAACATLLRSPPPARLAPHGAQGEEIVATLAGGQVLYLSYLMAQSVISAAEPTDFDVNGLVEPPKHFRELGLDEPATPLIFAASSFFTTRDDEGTPLISGNTQVIRELLDLRADVDKGTPKLGLTPLMVACKLRQPDVTRMLLESRANPNRCQNDGDKRFALMETCMGNSGLTLTSQAALGRAGDATAPERAVECAQILLAHGASVNQQDGSGYTALLACVESGLTELAELLIANHADTSASLKEMWPTYRPLMSAITHRNLAMVKLLVAARADQSAECGQQPGRGLVTTSTTLGWALRCGSLDCAVYLRDFDGLCERATEAGVMTVAGVDKLTDSIAANQITEQNAIRTLQERLLPAEVPWGPKFEVKATIVSRAYNLSLAMVGFLEWDEREPTSQVAMESFFESPADDPSGTGGSHGMRMLMGGKIRGFVTCDEAHEPEPLIPVTGQFNFDGQMMIIFETKVFVISMRSCDNWTLHQRTRKGVFEGQKAKWHVKIRRRTERMWQREPSIMMTAKHLENQSSWPRQEPGSEPPSAHRTPSLGLGRRNTHGMPWDIYEDGMDGEEEDEDEDEGVLDVGTFVDIVGVRSQPQLNGEIASVLGFDPSSGRYMVKVEATGVSIKLKPENLEPRSE